MSDPVIDDDVVIKAIYALEDAQGDPDCYNGKFEAMRAAIRAAVLAERAKSEKRIAELEAVIKPFCIAAETSTLSDGETIEDLSYSQEITLGDLRRARAALRHRV